MKAKAQCSGKDQDAMDHSFECILVLDLAKVDLIIILFLVFLKIKEWFANNFLELI